MVIPFVLYSGGPVFKSWPRPTILTEAFFCGFSQFLQANSKIEFLLEIKQRRIPYT
jgi:hypothetical protein